jgi:hypothetical protein
VSWQTLRRWQKKCEGNFPIKKRPGGRPAALKFELDLFLSGFGKCLDEDE